MERLRPMNRPSRSALLPLISLAVFMAVSTGCRTLYTRRVVFDNHPIALQVLSKMVDEETLEYSIKFRNIGREVMSFDYTVADEPGVPHVDQAGPNSGLVSNLYPGAEVEMPNPTNSMAVWVTIGAVTYGKKTVSELDAIYKPDQVLGVEDRLDGGGNLLLPPADNPLR